MLGFGKSIQLLKTRDIEQDLNGLFLNVQEGDEVWIITPYATMDKLTALKRAIAETAARGVNISFVVRDEPDQVDPAKKYLKEAMENGLNLYAFKRLHAKVYWFEYSGSIITSANLVDGSFEASTEIGLGIEPGKLHDDIRVWIDEIIKPGLRDLATSAEKKVREPNNFTKKASTSGFCLRCNSTIRYNPEKPYCLKDYRSWSKYSNPEFEEKFCHKCGKPTKSSLAKPICYNCYKAK